MTPSDWDVVREAIAKVEPPSDIIACGCIGLNDEQGRCRCEQDYPAGWALRRLQAENERLRDLLLGFLHDADHNDRPGEGMREKARAALQPEDKP